MRLKITIGAVLSGLMAASCGGGGGLAGEAEEWAEKQCACTTFDCTLDATQWFNKISITQEEDLAALGADDRARYDVAHDRSSACQDALR